MKIALIQLDIAWEDKKANLERAEKFIRKAAKESCDLVVFPEMFNTGFSMNIKEVAEDSEGETFRMLSGSAGRHRINVIAGCAVKSKTRGKATNQVLVFNTEGRFIDRYAKMHPFSFTGEDLHFVAGNRTVIFHVDGVPSSAFICYDLRFPEIFRKVAKGVKVIFVTANWPAGRKEHWETLLKARAIENQCFIVGVNRTGKDGNGIRYAGGSQVFDPLGNSVFAGGPREQFVVCEIDIEMVERVRAQYPFLKDMR